MKRAIVQVFSPINKITGTGFLLSKNGLVISCAHVIANASARPGDIIKVRFVENKSQYFSALILDDGWRDASGDDLCFLKIQEEIPDLQPLLLGSSKYSTTHSFQSFGFPEMRDEKGDRPFDGVWAKGEIMGYVDRKGGQKALQLSSFELEQGFSGAPILDTKTNHVVGIVTESQNISGNKKQQFIAWATPSDNIVEAYPNLYMSPSYIEIIPTRLSVNMFYPLMRAEFFSGRKSHLGKIKKFWAGEQPGTFALIGIGGAGKTAIVRHFLERSGWLESDQSDEYPDGVFVWSFYDNQDTEKFITEAYRYFSKSLSDSYFDRTINNADKVNLGQLIDVLQRSNGRFLIILDGLEKMQSDGKSSSLPRGTLVDPILRYLLTRITDGTCGLTKIIVTSRFSLSDLSEWPKNKYIEVDVNELERTEYRQLLRKLGVKGTDISLDLLASEYGRHALTLDILGRLISEYSDGSSDKVIEIPSLEFAEGSDKVEKQASRLARVLIFYESRSTATQIKIMELLCAFRWPVSFHFFSNLLTGEDSAKISPVLVNLTSDNLKSHLHKLKELRLLSIEKHDTEEVYTTHPAIRDHFYIRLTDPQETHEAIRRQLANLSEAPGFIRPKDARTIELIEELIYHTIKTGKTNDAFSIYRNNLGYRHLGWELGQHARGVGIVKMFDDWNIQKANSADKAQLEVLTIDNGLYLKNLGLLDQSIDCIKKIAVDSIEEDTNFENRASAYQNLSAVQVLRGKLIDAEMTARTALGFAVRTSDDRLIQDCQVRLGASLALQGRTKDAENIFMGIKNILTKERKKAIPRDWPGIRHGWLLMKTGKIDNARKELDDTREISEYFNYPIITSRADVLLAEICFKMGKISEARYHLDKVKEWSDKAFDQEMIIATNLVAAQIALEFGDYAQTKNYLYEGLRVSEESGHSIYWIDLKIVQGYLYLNMQDVDNAGLSVQQALEGIRGRGGRPYLLGANSPVCCYEWGRADALLLKAKAYLLTNKNRDAVKNLSLALDIQLKLQDPAQEVTKTLLDNTMAIS